MGKINGGGVLSVQLALWWCTDQKHCTSRNKNNSLTTLFPVTFFLLINEANHMKQLIGGINIILHQTIKWIKNIMSMIYFMVVYWSIKKN